MKKMVRLWIVFGFLLGLTVSAQATPTLQFDIAGETSDRERNLHLLNI